jgi:hypothetical protein
MDDIPESELRKYVLQFLKELKDLIHENGLFVLPHQKNKEALIDLGLTVKLRVEIVLSLSVSDYSAGPIRDEYEPGDYWVFGKKIDGVEVYIKLRITEKSGYERAKCLSFHKAERPLNYPFE